jgi:hypothetical protein
MTLDTLSHAWRMYNGAHKDEQVAYVLTGGCPTHLMQLCDTYLVRYATLSRDAQVNHRSVWNAFVAQRDECTYSSRLVA